jgi:lysozyme
MTTSPIGRAMITRWEGCRLRPYRDVVGLWTVGVGHLLGADEPTQWLYTEAEVDGLLARDLARTELGVQRLCGNVAQPQFDALVSFTFNCGVGALQRSQLRQRVLRRDPSAGDALLVWNKAGGKVWAGLTARRKDERARYYAA